jgi:hypothetical protein
MYDDGLDEMLVGRFVGVSVGGFALAWLVGGFVIGLTVPLDPKTSEILISGLPLSAVYAPSAPILKLWLFTIGALLVGGFVGG